MELQNRKRHGQIIGVPVGYFNGKHSKLPERVRVSFSDGTTAIYDLHIDMPAPVFPEHDTDVVVGYQRREVEA